MNVTHDFGPTIAALRAYRGLSASRFAKRIKMSPAYLSMIENGQRPPTPSAIERITAGLHVDLDGLDELHAELEGLST